MDDADKTAEDVKEIRSLLCKISDIDGYDYRIVYETNPFIQKTGLDNYVFNMYRRRVGKLFNGPWRFVDRFFSIRDLKYGISRYYLNNYVSNWINMYGRDKDRESDEGTEDIKDMEDENQDGKTE